MKSHEVIFILILIVIVTVKRTESTCGQRIIADKLLANGLQSIEGHWPWHAAIFHIHLDLDINYKCSGSIITSNAILTAAHCVYENGNKIIAGRIIVGLGKHVLTDFTHSQQFKAYRVISHPNYDTVDLKNDIAIVMLPTEATFNVHVQPICLWDSNKSEISKIIGKQGTVVGWGHTENDEMSNVLRRADVPVVSSSTCTDASPVYFQRYLTEKTFCAGYLNGTTLCNGDSGGGLVLQEDGVYRIRGIVSLTEAASQITCYSGSYVKNWYQAVHTCAFYQMQLAAINSIEEQNVAVELITPHLLPNQPNSRKRTWIGCNQLGEFDNVCWLSTGSQIKFFNWAVGEPNDERGNELCMNLEHLSNFRWNDLECNYNINFLCEDNSVGQA